MASYAAFRAVLVGQATGKLILSRELGARLACPRDQTDLQGNCRRFRGGTARSLFEKQKLFFLSDSGTSRPDTSGPGRWSCVDSPEYPPCSSGLSLPNFRHLAQRVHLTAHYAPSSDDGHSLSLHPWNLPVDGAESGLPCASGCFHQAAGVSSSARRLFWPPQASRQLLEIQHGA